MGRAGCIWPAVYVPFILPAVFFITYFNSQKKKTGCGRKSSVIAFAYHQNEEDNLKKNLPEILKLKNADLKWLLLMIFSGQFTPVLGRYEAG